MRASLAAILIGAALAACAPSSYGAEHAGRVLIAAGEVTILRGAQTIAAQSGTEVQSGDTVQLGSRSNAQLLLTDNSIIALRPETTFRLAQYHYTGQSAPGENAFLALLKGGMRTLTGIIGHIRHEEYHVTTPTATIGIRGTNYALVQCDNNCRNADGSLAPNGTYGAITFGRISVTNRTGEHVFGANQFFTVAGQNTPPQQLIGPPPFLQDTLQGRGRAGHEVAEEHGEHGKGQGGTSGAGGESASTVAQTGLGGGTGDTSVTSTTTSVPPPAVLVQTIIPVTSTPSVNTLLQTLTGTIFYRLAGSVSLPVSSCSNPPCGTITVADLTLGVNFTTNQAYLKADFVSLDQTGGSANIFNLGTPFSSGGIPITVSGGQATFNATINRSSFPNEQGAFRCLGCATNSFTSGLVPGYLDTISVSGTISGTQANLTLSGSSTAGGSGSFNATLTQAALPNPYGAAMVIPGATSSDPTISRSTAYWGVQVGSSQELLAFGSGVGTPTGVVGTATNTIVGSAPSYGDLVWGHWSGAGATIVDYDYNTYTTTGGNEPWITGQVTAALPTSLGTVTFTPVGSYIVGGSAAGTLNSASLTANFVSQSMSISLNTTTPGNGSTYQMNGTSGISSVSARFSAGFTSVSCTGTCSSGSPAGSFGGFFAGPNAEGAGVAFDAGYLGVSGAGVKGVVAFKR
ncbi:MAG TPA: FecR family protein [Burkholderiales bacterium]|nr:FecR family protein [Burkholderiales bacterium]